MNKKVLTSMLAICASAAMAAAQAPAQGNQAPATPPSPQSPGELSRPQSTMARAAAVTIEGCLQRAAAPNSATPGATGTSGSAAGAFVLANAMKSTAAGNAAAPASPAAGTAGRPGADASSAAIASTYRLDADVSKLSPHVGHKVEVTGTFENAPSAAAAAAPPASSSPAAANLPQLKVDSVKMVAATCTP